MKGILLQDDVKHVEDRIKTFEANTGCELLLVVAPSSDEYPGAIWRFALVFGFLGALLFSFFYEFHHGYLWPFMMFFLSLLGAFIGHFPWAKALAMSDQEMKRETYEKAVELFHTLGTSQVQHKVTAMIMLSIFERKITVLVDEKLKEQISQSDLDHLIAVMRLHFKSGNTAQGLALSIENLESNILKKFNGRVSSVNHEALANKIHFVKD